MTEVLRVSRDTSYTSRMVTRTLRIVEVLALADCSLSVREIFQTTQIPRVTIYRILRTLREEGYVHRDLDRRYSLANFRLFSKGGVKSEPKRTSRDWSRERMDASRRQFLTGAAEAVSHSEASASVEV